MHEDDRITIEPLIDPAIRYIALHWNESTFSYRGNVAKEYNTSDEDTRTPEEIRKSNECPVCHGKNGNHQQITNGSEWFDCPRK